MVTGWLEIFPRLIRGYPLTSFEDIYKGLETLVASQLDFNPNPHPIPFHNRARRQVHQGSPSQITMWLIFNADRSLHDSKMVFQQDISRPKSVTRLSSRTAGSDENSTNHMLKIALKAEYRLKLVFSCRQSGVTSHKQINY